MFTDSERLTSIVNKVWNFFFSNLGHRYDTCQRNKNSGLLGNFPSYFVLSYTYITDKCFNFFYYCFHLFTSFSFHVCLIGANAEVRKSYHFIQAAVDV